MAQLLILSSARDEPSPLAALDLLSHQIRRIPAEAGQLLNAPSGDVFFIDARDDLANAKKLCRLVRSTTSGTPVIVVIREGGLAAVSLDWGMDDIIVTSAGPAETDARIRLAINKYRETTLSKDLDLSGIAIDESTYSAKVNGKPLDLTYREFQLLNFFATNPSRVFSREQLVAEVWGYDYFGGTRTVDVHVRRLRAKLGDHEQLISTVRNVGYRFTAPNDYKVHAESSAVERS